MNKNNAAPAKNSNIEKTLKFLTARRELPKFTIIFFMMIYIATTILTSRVARSEMVLMFGELAIPLQSFTGVVSSLGNICTILMVVLFKKLGYIVSLVSLVTQIPFMILNLFRNHSVASVSGIFTTILTAVAITIIFANDQKVEKYQKKMRDQAVTDRLTGLPNRYACNELVNKLAEQDRKFAIVSIDLNNFKGINDTMGQNTGNEVLREVAARWKRIADTGASGTLDFIIRQGGDEFILIVRGYYSDKELLDTIKCYEAALDEKITADECDLFITASFGYAEFPTDNISTEALFICADAAMYEVKRVNSSDRILHFTPDLLKTEHTIEVEREIRAALENDSIYFNLQPQFDMDHKLRGFEALARMKDADGNNVSPGEFIPVAEKVGLIDKVDGAVFRKSAEFIGRMIKETGADITLSVNVSVRHLMKNGFLKELREIIETSGIPTIQLEVEITESIMIESMEKALSCISEIKEMGIQIAIDDFGTGYSSLSYLHRFPADLLKVDKSFIDKMNTGESSKQYVASIISIGHIMGFDVISEGVEEEEQLDTLRDIGCDYIQGFIWGRPLSEEDAEKLIRKSVGA